LLSGDATTVKLEWDQLQHEFGFIQAVILPGIAKRIDQTTARQQSDAEDLDGEFVAALTIAATGRDQVLRLLPTFASALMDEDHRPRNSRILATRVVQLQPMLENIYKDTIRFLSACSYLIASILADLGE
jgi:hypothetical protein